MPNVHTFALTEAERDELETLPLTPMVRDVQLMLHLAKTIQKPDTRQPPHLRKIKIKNLDDIAFNTHAAKKAVLTGDFLVISAVAMYMESVIDRRLNKVAISLMSTKIRSH